MSLINLFFGRDKAEAEKKIISKLLGSRITADLDALQFLSKHFSHHHKLPRGWRGSIIEKTLYEKFGELLTTYKINPTIIQEPMSKNVLAKITSKLKFKNK